MCRFLIANFQEETRPEKFLADFATACEKSPHWQGDGWGIAWRENGLWQSRKSLKPIWEDTKRFADFSASGYFLIHARGSSFPRDRGNLDFNQPFIREDKAFVFNGFLNGVRLPAPVPGAVGAEKIFNLVLREGLEEAADLLLKNSKLAEALNIGLAAEKEISVFSYFSTEGDYHRIYSSEDSGWNLVCSVPIGDFDWRPLEQGQMLSFSVF